MGEDFDLEADRVGGQLGGPGAAEDKWFEDELGHRAEVEDSHTDCADWLHDPKNRSVIRNDPLSRSIMSFASKA